ncbi:Adaptor for signal transduction [Nowakowskiella sp. JEL0078]|nr:Adaptor for signal transduction [Nowakowskiella sp. JEL0078]
MAREKRIPDTDHEIDGSTLVRADHDLLKFIGIASVGLRLSLLRAIYNAKITYGVPFGNDDFKPESSFSANDRNPKQKSEEFSKLEIMIKDRDLQIQRLNHDVSRLNSELAKLRDEISPVWTLISEFKKFEQKSEARETNKKGSTESRVKSAGSSSSKSTIATKSPLKHTPSSSISPDSSNLKSPPSNSTKADPNVGAIRVYGDKLLNRENQEYKSFQVSITDPCSKILPAALKKYNITDDWQKYALFIQFKGKGISSNFSPSINFKIIILLKERCLSFDECPLQLRNGLKEGDDVPVFILKHIKQVGTTAIRNTMSRLSLLTDASSTLARRLSAKQTDSNFSQSKSELSYATTQTGVKGKGVAAPPDDGFMNYLPTAVAIYEYRADREDELDVAIGEKFKILGRETGWCVVERNGRRGWVPAGCLMESVDEEQDSQSEADAVVRENSNPQKGVVLYDYDSQSQNELSITKGTTLLITKKYEHWVLAEFNNKKGWVPSCYVSMNDDKNQEPIKKIEEIKSAEIAELTGEDEAWNQLMRSARSGPTGTNNNMNGTGSGTAVLKLDSLLDDINPYLSDDRASKEFRSNHANFEKIVSSFDRFGDLLVDMQVILTSLQARINHINKSTDIQNRFPTTSSEKLKDGFSLTSILGENINNLSSNVQSQKFQEAQTRLEDIVATAREKLKTTNSTSNLVQIIESCQSTLSAVIELLSLNEGQNSKSGFHINETITTPSSPLSQSQLKSPIKGIFSIPNIRNNPQKTVDLQKELKARMKVVGQRDASPNRMVVEENYDNSQKKTSNFVYTHISYEELITRTKDTSLDVANLEACLLLFKNN